MPRSKKALCAGAVALAPFVVPAPAMAQFHDESIVAFHAADGDGDEMLTRDEFRTFIRQMADYGAPMSQRIRTFGAYRMAFNRVDADANGLATPDELRAADAQERQ